MFIGADNFMDFVYKFGRTIQKCGSNEMNFNSTKMLLAGMAMSVAPLMTATAGETLDRVMETKTLVGATADGYPPVAFTDENNQLTGFDVEVAREIAKRLGAEFKPVTPSWEAQVAGNWAGRWDIAVGSMTPTTARAEVLDFPAVYYYTPAILVAHKDNTSFEKASDLDGKVVGACAACSYEDYLRHKLVMDVKGVPAFEYEVTPGRIQTYESDGMAFDDLRLGDGVRVDAVLSNVPTATAAIENNMPFRMVGEPLVYEPLAVAVDKGDPEFSAKITEIVDAMRADGTLKALSEKWFGVDLTSVN